jgi:hypothetical protein
VAEEGGTEFLQLVLQILVLDVSVSDVGKSLFVGVGADQAGRATGHCGEGVSPDGTPDAVALGTQQLHTFYTSSFTLQEPGP